MSETNAAPDPVPPADSGLDILRTFGELKEALFRYYNTPFGLADRQLEQEREALFNTDGGAWRRPLLEVRPRYQPADCDLAGSTAQAGAPAEFADLISRGLVSGIPSLYQHQHRSLLAAFRDQRDVVVTAGTGSGKTESFMLPILADLVRESASWGPATLPVNRWWSDPKGRYQAQRTGEQGRHQAVRAMVLYPMNALVDDQMMRLRKALDSDEVRQWLARHRPGHRFYFGRYTGATPVPGDVGSSSGQGTLRREFTATEKRAAQAAQAEGDTRFFVPRLDGAEMRSRWDMIDAPPDIMITNYSMLNVMMLRPRESGIFDRTRQWLEEVPGARFTLVVDELHMYRGTSGTEVAYLVRNLRQRLGLDRHPERLRVLAASASLEAPRDLDFLQEFFGVERERFEVLGGELILPDHDRTDLSQHAEALAALGPEPAPNRADAALAATGAADVLVNALREGKRLVSRSDAETAAILFKEADADEQDKALQGLLGALRKTTLTDAPKLRGHLFFRNIPGVWACSDPECSGVTRTEGQERTVGRLYPRPTPRCEDCQARVLELLYCQNCGDVFLGGHAPEQSITQSQGRQFNAGLLADLPDLDQLPDRAVTGQTAANYIVYWPRTQEPVLDKLEWSRTAGKKAESASFQFKRSSYNPLSGRLTNSAQHTGWSFHTEVPRSKNGKQRLHLEDLPAAPTQCPACGDDRETPVIGGRDHLLLSDQRRMRSPIRSMRTGFEKVNQVITTAMLSGLPEKKAVVFSDSRQDAAKLAAGLGLRHYQDLLRLMLAEEISGQGDPVADLAAISAYYQQTDTTPEGRQRAVDAMLRIKPRDPQAYAAWAKTQKPHQPGGLDDLEDLAEEAPVPEAELYALLSRVPSIEGHVAQLEEALVALGVNPGGPKASLQQTRFEKGTEPAPWSTLYDWRRKVPGPVPGTLLKVPGPVPGTLLTERQRELRESIGESLSDELLNGLFGSAGRDFESLGLGWLCLATDQDSLEADPASDTALARASLRVLGHMRRFSGLRSGQDDPPKKLRLFWDQAAARLATTPEDIRARVERTWGGAVVGFIIQPVHTAIRHGHSQAWTCTRCHRRHLHPGIGVCTNCGRDLPKDPVAFNGADEDYYAWMAKERLGRFRLNCAELTGQTGRIEAQGRQARFQGVFLEEKEDELPDSLDILSVTTTMEAGVDIGPLSVVLMANMPPTRFNYQQRIGRAGRRNSPVALALTVCRGRSHDEYYFQSPSRITNDPTPRPYLSTEMPDIYQRVLAAEVLRRAFAETAAAEDNTLDPTRNVHGQFGLCDEWHAARAAVQNWISRSHDEVSAIAEALSLHTRGSWPLADTCAWVQHELLRSVDKIAGQDHGHRDLSQRLAEEGLLPMFGFPTSVRYLYTSKPGTSYPWPPKNVVDRALPIAVSQFAPGAETVKDGNVHTAFGVVAYEPSGPEAKAVQDPLGQARSIGLCRACGHIEESPSSAPQAADEEQPALPCRACGAVDGSYQVVELREPLGFYAGHKRDFDGNFSWRARSLAPRTAADLEKAAPRQQLPTPLAVHAGKGRRYAVNDNGGRLFTFHPLKPTARWTGAFIEQSALEKFSYLANDTSDREPVTAAIGAVQVTDLFLLGPERAELPETGTRFNLASVPQISGYPDDRSGRKAAWYSLAALLRSAAGARLQIQPNEIASGIHGATTLTGGARVFAFLSDTLDNGAGYCTRLADPEEFSGLLAKASEMIEGFSSGTHGRECRGSCYECLRDYSNMAYHSLLDWRLAAELMGLLNGESIDADAFSERSGQLLHSWAADPGLDEAQFLADLRGTGPAVLFQDRLWVAAKHPFEAADPLLEGPRLAAVREAVRRETPDVQDVVFVDDFLLDRVPGRVTGLLEGFDPA